ncbi:MAG: hypothetical protein RLZZ156_591 [Deinococcota bacterium]|jgi:hypothetical protein
MFHKVFLLVFGAFLVACGSTSTNFVNQSFDLALEVNQEVRGVSATIEYQPQDYQFVKLEKNTGLISAMHETRSGLIQVSFLASGNVQGQLGQLRFKSLRASNQSPKIQRLEVVTSDKKTIVLIQPANRGLRPQSLAISNQVEANYGQFPLGDTDQSAVVNITDAVNALNIDVGLLVPTSIEGYLADINGDGEVSTLDAVLILDKSVDPNLATQPIINVIFQSATVQAGGTWLVLFGNSGNQALPNISSTIPTDVTVSELPALANQNKVFQFTFAQNAVSNSLTFQIVGFPDVTLFYTISDSIAPTIGFDTTPRTITTSQQVNIDFTVTDNIQVQTVRLFNQIEILQTFTGTSPYQHVFIANPRKNGTHLLRIEARDIHNNVSASGEKTVIVDIPAFIVSQNNCSSVAVGDTCSATIQKIGSSPAWKGFGFDIQTTGFNLTAINTNACLSNYATLSPQVYRIGAICDTTSSGEQDVVILQLTRTATGATSLTTQNVMLATDTIPAVTLPIEGDSVSVSVP